MPTTVFAFSCHPDDIEFMMGGTLFLLKRAGCVLHYMNLADGSCGSTELGPAQTAARRLAEARAAAALLGAEFHEPLAPDLEVFYTPELVRRATAVMRRVKPDILLLPSPEDYMEDHMNTSRVGVTAAFCRGMPNYASLPPEPPTFQDVVLYHALPYGLADGLRRPVQPDFFVDIGAVIEQKQAMLACHQSQLTWLKDHDNIDALEFMDVVARTRGFQCNAPYAEGFRSADVWPRTPAQRLLP
jgi:LmbE family N-acetylglucosaminyl deacetylase